ncbi:MAG: lysylphosphatidylglycerol synthase transmembrane domain-containing protein, partial [Actinomycetota bacterium]
MAFLFLLALIAPVEDWARSLLDASPSWILAGVVTVVALGGLDAVRLRLLAGASLSAVALTHMVFVASCVAHLPFGVIGSDVYRATAMRRLGVESATSVGAVAAARTLGFMASLLATCAGVVVVLVTGQTYTGSAGVDGIGWTALFLLGAGLLLWVTFGAVMRLVGTRFRMPAALVAAGNALGDLRGRLLLEGAGLSLLIASMRIFVVMFCAAAIGARVPVTGSVIATGAGVVSSIVPSALGGVGPQEAGLAGTLLLFGVAPFLMLDKVSGTVAYATAVKSVPVVLSSARKHGLENYPDFYTVNSAEATQILSKAENILQYMAYGPLSL